MLSILKKIPKAFSEVKSGHWRDSEDILRSNELFDKTVGIIGFGRIGSNLARYANAFKMRVLAYDPFVKITQNNVIQKKNFKEVLRNSDVIFICVNLNKKTINMINNSWIKNLKKDCILINTSRGEVIDENQIIKYLKSNKKFNFATDVISNEQKKINKNLLIKNIKKIDNLNITPHIAGLTVESETKAAEQSLLTLNNFFKN